MRAQHRADASWSGVPLICELRAEGDVACGLHVTAVPGLFEGRAANDAFLAFRAGRFEDISPMLGQKTASAASESHPPTVMFL
mmetsp:Transcript_116170/g.276091  ORF Transcript_116170/g.276091 Transcript_116170/m.276091 type:complete len:83 (-) Transcript_116170:31-279(-)